MKDRPDEGMTGRDCCTFAKERIWSFSKRIGVFCRGPQPLYMGYRGGKKSWGKIHNISIVLKGVIKNGKRA